MADRSAAALFASFFELLAENPDERNKELAKKLAAKTRGYDFCTYQMSAEESLLALGLARMSSASEMKAEDVEDPFIINFDDDGFSDGMSVTA